MIKLFPHQQSALDLTDSKNKVADIKGYEGLYCVDELGNVYSLITTQSRRKGIIKPFINTGGYLRVNLHKNGVQKKYYIHRLVAEAFIPNPNNYKEVNHINCNRQKNCVDNLEWCSRSQNVKYTYVVGGRLSNRSTHINNTYRGIKVRVKNLLNDEVHQFETLKQASLHIGRYSNYISEKFRRKNCNTFQIDNYVIFGGD